MTDTELRRLAENATPGPWRCEPMDNGTFVVRGRPLFALAACPSGSAAAYIAAASPDVVLALLDRIKALEVERDAMDARIAELEREKSDMMRGAAKALEEALRAHAAKGGE